MGLLKKITAGGPIAKTRLHSLDGDLIDLARLRFTPLSLATSLGRKFFGYRPGIPWLEYRAVRHLNTLLQPDWVMIEFGSGMSTVWFAKRVKHVYSIEDDAPWYDRVRARFDKLGVHNVTYKLLEGDEYANADFVEDSPWTLFWSTARKGTLVCEPPSGRSSREDGSSWITRIKWLTIARSPANSCSIRCRLAAGVIGTSSISLPRF